MSKQLDNFFKNKLRDRSFDYDESAWEDARLLIEENEKSKRRRRWFILFSSLLLISIVGTTAYYLGKESVHPKKQDIPNKVIAENNGTSNITNTISSNTNQRPFSSSLLQESTNKDSAKTSTNDAAKKILADTNNYQKRNSTLKDRVDKNKVKTKQEYKIALGAAGVAQPSGLPVTTIYNPQIDAAATLTQSSKLIHSKDDNQRLGDILLLSNKIDNFDFVIDANILNLLPTMIVSPQELPSKTIMNKWFLGARAGASLIPSTFRSLDGGIFVQYNINRNFSLSLQPHYTYQELTQQATEETIITNAFGLRTTAFSLVPKSIRSIHAPLLFSFSFGNGNLDLSDVTAKRYMKHKLSTGFSYVYLDGIVGSIESREPISSSVAVENGWLDASSFRRHNAEVIFGYEYYLTKRLSLGTMLRYRVRNQFSDDFIQQNTTVEQPGSFYLGLQTLFRFN